jgi:hypothetical protein
MFNPLMHTEIKVERKRGVLVNEGVDVEEDK